MAVNQYTMIETPNGTLVPVSVPSTAPASTTGLQYIVIDGIAYELSSPTIEDRTV